MSATKIIIDTDPGVGIPGTDADDPIALLFALADPRLDLLAVTSTFGNCPPWITARGARKVLDTASRTDIPVAQGLPLPLSGTLADELQEAYRGDRGRLGRVDLPELSERELSVSAPQLIIDTVKANPGEVTIVAIGPQTNVAAALLMCPEIKDDIAEIVFMGGGLGINAEFGRGNVTPVAECNIYFDPIAANVVFNSGIPMRMVSLDVTNPATGQILREETIEQIDASASPSAELFAQICATYMEKPMFDWGHGCVLYDPLAVLAVADPTVGTWEDMAVRVETKGEYTLGQTVPIRGAKPNMRVMTDVDGTSSVDEIVRVIETL
ncbi:inosine/uridine-preferring nucleoside hydrolase [Bifidobacterium margollesii]|uniref:Inosine/uridine-preferring nucleoside hydrolase n=2 Tax=Bifidobacterium margollesii TaxID=2020964 RepID=A0A2N5JD36_9BIFI|nr:inosine/uridine-preferring nucleoside hydrolase [Bifidobacterium margollesii]